MDCGEISGLERGAGGAAAAPRDARLGQGLRPRGAVAVVAAAAAAALKTDPIAAPHVASSCPPTCRGRQGYLFGFSWLFTFALGSTLRMRDEAYFSQMNEILSSC